jgi:hypothetical protein
VPATAWLDTLVIRPDDRLFTPTWRASLALKRDIFEVPECIIGWRPTVFWRARRLGKKYYPSLRDLVDAKAKEPVE